jgi:hypothetical protein
LHAISDQGKFFFYPNNYLFTPTYFKIFQFYPCLTLVYFILFFCRFTITFPVNCTPPQNSVPVSFFFLFSIFILPIHFLKKVYRFVSAKSIEILYRNTFHNCTGLEKCTGIQLKLMVELIPGYFLKVHRCSKR